MEDKNKLRTEKIFKLLMSLAIPSIVAQLVNILYNMVDRIYIGHIENAGNAMASLSVALPIITLITAFTNLIGSGGAPLCAISLGKQDKQKAEEIMTNSFVMLICLGVVLTVGVLIFKEQILYLFGASDETIDDAVTYTTIYACGTLFVQISLGMNAYINTQGFARISMTTVLIGALLNIALDPLFIFVFDMGVAGAALATIISQAVSAIWVLKFLFGKKTTIKLRKKYLKIKPKTALSIIALGLSPFVMTSTESILQISFNNQLSYYGGTVAVASMAIFLSAFQFVQMPLLGLCQGAQPILSYNYGAGDFERVRKAFKLVFTICLSFCFVFCVLFMIFSKQLVSIFTNDVKTIEFATWGLRVYLLGMVIFGMQISCQHSFVALGQAKLSIIMAVLRKIVLLIPLIYILPYVLGNSQFAYAISEPINNLVNNASGVFCVLFAEPIADFTAAIVTSISFALFYKKTLKP